MGNSDILGRFNLWKMGSTFLGVSGITGTRFNHKRQEGRKKEEREEELLRQFFGILPGSVFLRS